MNSNLDVSAKSLSKNYVLKHLIKDAQGNIVREHKALQDISFEIKKGESVGIIGPNGSGKSTLLKILSGVTKPTSGNVEIVGRVASILDIGAGFHQELSGRENIFLNGKILGFSHKEIEQQFEQIIDFSGIGSYIEEPVKNYSNGMYLRLAFSILAQLDFDVYLFDEVMSVGDAEFIQKTRNKINQLRSKGKTLIIISHNQVELNQCNYIIELEQGRIKKMGSETEILSKYFLESVEKSTLQITKHNTTITHFEQHENSSNIITLLSVKIHQPNSTDKGFCTNNEFYIDITYQKHFPENTISPFIIVSDAGGTIIFVSSPILSGDVNDSQNQGTYKVSCKIKSEFFSSNVYALSITFVRNSHVFKRYPNNQELSAENIKSVIGDYGIVASYPNIIYFRCIVIIKNFIDLGKLNLPVGMLLPSFDWTTSAISKTED